MVPKYFILVIGIFLISISSEAQISKVNYQLKFNEQTNLFDCYLIAKKGFAQSSRHRAQFNAQYTVMVPSGSRVLMAESFMPLQNNQEKNSVIPTKWEISNTVKKPASDPFYDYISVIPSLSPVSFYNDIAEGDEVKLFSVGIFPVTDCGASVKLFENGIDLNSGARGMHGGDFSNGFTMGGVGQKYAGNDEQVIPNIKVIKQLEKSINKGIAINVNIDQNFVYGPLSYEWTGPANFRSEEKNVNISKPAQDQYGVYNVIVTDARGCTETRSIEVLDKKNQFPHVDMRANVADLKIDEIENRNLILNNLPETNIKIYPNPANNFISVNINDEIGSDINIDILDINGRVIRKAALNTILQEKNLESNISVQDILPGIYNLSITINKKESTHRLIVVR